MFKSKLIVLDTVIMIGTKFGLFGPVGKLKAGLPNTIVVLQ